MQVLEELTQLESFASVPVDKKAQESEILNYFATVSTVIVV